MDYFPIFLALKNQPCLIVGAGDVATRKLTLLSKTQAKLTVIATKISPKILALKQAHNFTILQKTFQPDDIKGFKLVISATDDLAVNTLVAESAKALNIPVNVVDNPALCSFIFPSIIDRSPIVAAVSSGGSAPVLARLLRAKIESMIPPAYGQLAELAEQFRHKVKAQFIDPAQRRIFWEQIFQGPIAELVFAGKPEEAGRQIEHSLASSDRLAGSKGEVYLIGAGPGAVDLLTFRALRLMQQADVIVYDRLVSPEIIELARRDADKIYVGKQRKDHTLPQEDINKLLAELAISGKRVARLKGGDPFIFGRGGEEIETLMEQGINFQVVPGITAASGCASYAGIPLTHRDHAHSCIFVTGHLQDGSINLNWPQLAAPRQTVVIYMGLAGLEIICSSLIQHGCPEDTPAALIQQGTTVNQSVFTGTLKNLPAQVSVYDVKAPTLIIIGNVVTLREKLRWFYETAPELK